MAFAPQRVVAATTRTIDDGTNHARATPYTSPALRTQSGVQALTPGQSQQAQLVRSDDSVVTPGYTPFSHTVRNPDGSYTIQAYAVPAFHEVNGSWQAVDLTLTPGSAGAVNAPNAYVPLSFGSGASSLLSLSLPHGQVTLQPQGLQIGAPSVSGQTVTFGSVAADTDLQYTVTDSGVKEALVLKTASAPTSFTFHLADPSHALGTATAGANGSYSFSGSVIAGQPIQVPPPIAYEDSGSGPPLQQFGSAHLSLVASGNGYDETISVDPTWLNGKSFPVVLDPGLNYTSSDDVFAPATPGFAPDVYSYLDAGISSTTIWRSFLKFPLPIGTSNLPYNSQITSAHVFLYRYQCNGTPCPPSTAFEVRGMTGAWSDTTTSATLDSLIDSQVLSSGYGSDGSSAEWQNLDVTPLVQQWVDQQYADNGIVWKASTEKANYGQNYYYSTRASSSNKPYISLTFQAPLLGQQSYLKFFQAQLTDRSSIAVNLSTGGLLVQNQDLAIAGTNGWNLQLDRDYNSLDTSSHAFGNDWKASFGPDVSLTWSGSDTSTVTFTDTTGTSFVYTNPNASGLYLNSRPVGSFAGPPIPGGGVNADLTKGSNGFDLVYHQSQEDLHFDPSGRLITDKDRNGNAITFAYNGSTNQLTQVSDSHNRHVSVTAWSSNAQLIQELQDPTGRNVQYSYDGNNNLTQYTDAASNTWTYTYNGSALTDIKDNASGHETEITYTSDLKHVAALQFITNSPSPGDGPTYTFAYHPGHTVVTDPRSNPTTYTFDDLDRVYLISDPLGHTEQENIDWYNSNVTGVIDAYGKTMTNTYATDGSFDLKSSTAPTGESASLTYPTTTGSFSGWQYMPTGGADAQGNSSSYTYDANGNMSASTNALNNNVSIDHNSGDGTVKGIKDAKGNVTSGCNSQGSYTECFTYTGGDLTGVVNPSNVASETIGVDGLSRETSQYYGPSSSPIDSICYTYDAVDRVTAIAPFTSGTCNTNSAYVTRTYDADGNLTQQTDSSGTTNFTYDPLNRLTVKQPPNSVSDCSGVVTGQTTCYSWDAANNLATYQDSGGTTSYGYDAANRLTSLQDPGNQTTTFQYNNDNSRTVTTYPNGVTLTNAYDDSQRISSVTIKNANGVTLQSYTYCYNLPLSNCGTENGDTSLRQRVVDAAGNTTIYLYDKLNRLCDARTTNSGGTQLSHYVYLYDANGNVTSVTVGSTTVNSICATSIPSNGSTTSYSYNAANQLSGNNSQGTVYDNGGTGTGDVTTDGPAGVSSTYNALEQTATQTPSGQAAISDTYSGPYQDDRLSQTQNGTTTTFTDSTLGVTAQQTGVGQPTYFIRDNKGMLVEERVWNTTSLSYVSYDYLFDALGTVTGLDASGSATTPDNTYTYAPFGAASSVKETVPNPFRFAGYYLDSATGLYHVGQRYYDPASGAAPWEQRDPISNPSNPTSWDRYVYSGDDPINFTDPTGGFDWAEFGWGMGLLVAGLAMPAVAVAFGVGTAGLVLAAGIGLFSALAGTMLVCNSGVLNYCGNGKPVFSQQQLGF